MIVFLIAFIVFATAISGMAVGVILSNRCLKGTCGGLAGIQDANGDPACQMCSTPSGSCQGLSQPTEDAAHGRDPAESA